MATVASRNAKAAGAGSGGGFEISGRVAPFVLIASGIIQYVGAAIAVSLFAHANSVSVGWGRLLTACIMLGLWRRPWPRTSSGAFDWRTLRTSALFGLMLASMNITFYLAIERIALGTTVALEFLGPVALAALTGRGWKVRTGIGFALAGVFLISWVGVDISDRSVQIGVFWALVAGGFWAFYMWMGRKIATSGNPLDGLTLGIAAGVLAYAPIAAPGFAPILGSWKLLGLMFLVGLCSSVIQNGLDQVIMKALPPARFALLNSLLPAISLGVGLVTMGQIPTWGEAAGLACVTVAVALATSPEDAAATE